MGPAGDARAGHAAVIGAAGRAARPVPGSRSALLLHPHLPLCRHACNRLVQDTCSHGCMAAIDSCKTHVFMALSDYLSPNSASMCN